MTQRYSGNSDAYRRRRSESVDRLYYGPRKYSRRNNAARKRKQKRKRILLIAAAIVLALLLALFVMLAFFPVLPSYHAEAGSTITIRELLRFPDSTAAFAEDSESFDTNVPGTYQLRIKTRIGVHSCKLIVEDTKAPVVETRAVLLGKDETCSAEDFISSVEDFSEITVSFLKGPDYSLIDQEQKVEIEVADAAGNRVEKEALLTILPIRYRLELEAGSEPPDISEFTGEAEPSYDEEEETEEDSIAPVNYYVTDISALDYNAIGENDIEIMYHGTVYPAKICIVDHEPPRIVSADDFTTFLGDPIRYKEHIFVEENAGSYEISVDTSQVDTGAVGTYPVTYTVTDSSGNSASITIQMTLVEKTADEEALFARVDQILAGLLSDDMSKTEKVWAIYNWIRMNVGWQNESPKDDYIKAATRALDWASGDCYAYFSISKVMLTRAGIKNMDIERIPDGEEMHYWNLVDVDDGHGWYHFDATPFEPLYTSCLCTDAELMELNSYGQYNYDRTRYPGIK